MHKLLVWMLAGLACGTPAMELDEFSILTGKSEMEVRELLQKIETNTAAGDTQSQALLGLWLVQGQFFGRDVPRGVSLIRASVASGNANAKAYLALLHDGGTGVPRDASLARKLATEAANAGSAVGEFVLGYMVETGVGGSADAGEAAKLYRRAAEHGSGMAQAELGRLLLTGKGVQRNPVEARAWFEKSASRTIRGMRMFGGALLEGVGGPTDVGKGLEWVGKAADAGDADAAGLLGFTYYEGRVVARNLPLAKQWLRTASDRGSGSGMFLLAHALLSERQDADTCRESLQLLRSALSGRVARAANLVGYLHATGQCVAEDTSKALTWFLAAEALGYAAAGEDAARIRQGVSEQVARDAASRARQCLQKEMADCL